ncbi:MAG: helix-turn-helix domain-containing protein [Rhodocyclaceae bacterium]
MRYDVANDADETPAPQAETVGAMLRAAREAAHLSHDDVASALKFSPRQIAALEADDYAALPGATIVRGFVRNYARLLKLDAAPLLQRLDAVLPLNPAEVRPPDKIGVANESRRWQELSPWSSLLLVLSFAALLLALWHFFGPAPQHAASAVVGKGTPVAKANEVTPAIPSPTPAMASTAENTAASPSPPEAGEALAPALRFTFADRSWVEVSDANGRILHSGENPPGSQLELSGQPPFGIVIGNASKVTLSYRGRSIDLAPHTRAEVARLTLE